MNDKVTPPPVTCARCNSTQIAVVNVEGNGQEYNVTDGVCAGLAGALCLGPIGLVFALCGIQNKKKDELVRMCLNCGHKF